MGRRKGTSSRSKREREEARSGAAPGPSPPAPASRSGRLRFAALALAAVGGAAVMVVELGAARALTPVFGGSISVWAVILAVTMLALAAGYAVGGRWADRAGGLVVARRAALAGALLVAALPFLRAPLLLATGELSILAGSTLSAAVLVAPALFFLGQISPALIRGLSRPDQVGSAAGGVYSVSTVGSLVGTLAAGLWLLPYGSYLYTCLGTAAVLLVPLVAVRPVLPAGGIVVILVLAAQPLVRAVPDLVESNAENHRCELLEVRQSRYGEIRVIEISAQKRYLLVNGTDQGAIDLRSGESVYLYDRALVAVARLYVPDARRVLVIGLGPGVIPRRLAEEGCQVDVVELDPEVVQVARDQFRWQAPCVIDDGRHYLRITERRWDLILVDAFLGGNPPWQLYTREAFEQYRERLTPGGAVVANFIGSSLDPEQKPALEAIVATAGAAFEVVEAYPDPSQDPWPDFPTRNIYVVAARHPRRSAVAEGSPQDASASIETRVARSLPVDVKAGRVLTDDAAPLEPLVRRTTELLRGRARRYIPASLLVR